MTSSYKPSFQNLNIPCNNDYMQSGVTPTQADTMFWNYMNREAEKFFVEYPTSEGSFMDPYSSIWNLGNFPSLVNCIKDHGHNFAGVTDPYMYYGRPKSIFCFHIEDLSMYSINYLYWGAPKSWIVIEVPDAPRFEKMVDIIFQPNCKNFLSHKTTAISPELLDLFEIKYHIVSSINLTSLI